MWSVYVDCYGADFLYHIVDADIHEGIDVLGVGIVYRFTLRNRACGGRCLGLTRVLTVRRQNGTARLKLV